MFSALNIRSERTLYDNTFEIKNPAPPCVEEVGVKTKL
jgi:hypothetical protein